MRRTLLASLLTLAAGAALAQVPTPAPQLDPVTTIARIDTNHDGAASRKEWVA